VANEVSVDLVLKPTSDKAAFSKVEAESRKAGESAGDSFGGGFKSGVASVAKVAAVAAAAAGAAIAFGFKKGIDAAIVQEDAVNRLNTALQITGKFSQQASEDLQKFASQLQTTTKFGDEAILSSAGLIQQLANLDTQGLKRATKASTELASALKIDLESASTLVAKAIEGNTASLGRYGIKIKASANETENLANVLGAIEGKFGGTAAAQINTYSGAITQSGNAFGDLLEKVGDFVIKSPVVISLIKDTTKFFAESADAVEKFRLNFNLIEDLINPLARFNEGVITYVIAPLELVGNIGRFAFDKIIEGVSAAVAVIGQAGGKIAEFLNSFGVDNNLTQGLQAFGETSTQVFNEAAAQAGKSFQSILDFPLSDGLALKNEELRLKLEERNQIAVEKNQELNTTVTDGAKGLGDIFSSIIDQNSFFTQDANKQTVKSLEETNKMTEAFAKKTGAAIQNGIGVAAGNAFAAFGKALAEGENAASAFADAFIQSIGQIAVQQGTAFILQGLAYSFIPGPSQAMAGGLIAAGAALATFGGAISALSGGGKKSAVGGGGIGMSADTQVFSSPQETLSQPDEIAQRSESGPRVQLIVQGDIFNTEDTGNRLIDILNSNFENKGNSFNNARFA
jgi:hypothetical protein